jgi:hypothetical protein
MFKNLEAAFDAQEMPKNKSLSQFIYRPDLVKAMKKTVY